MATGGGPGAMEAAKLGAYLGSRPPRELEDALSMLAAVPAFKPSVQAWTCAAFDVLERRPEGMRSIGIPT